MKKYENQLPQAGRGNVHVAYQGKAIDQMIYDFMEEQGIPEIHEKKDFWEPVKRLLDKKKKGKWGYWDEIHIEQDDL